MLPKINLELNSVQLFEAQAAVGGKLKGFDEFQKLSERDQELILEYLRDYSRMLQSYVMSRYYVKPEEAQAPAVYREPEKPRQPCAPKEKVLADWNENYKKAFGCEPKRIA